MNWWILRRKIHVSWLIAVLAGAVIFGVVMSQYINQTLFAPTVFVVTGLSAALTAIWKPYVYLLPLLVIGGGLIGLWRGSIEQQQLSPYSQIIGVTATVTGYVTEDVDLGKNDELIVRLSHLAVNGNELQGKVWASLDAQADIKRGDQLTVRGNISEGFGSFSAAIYRADLVQLQRPIPGDVARQVRDSFADNIRASVSEPEASLGIGYLVGQRRALPTELDEALRIVGLTHVVVASGYNLTILVRLARRLFVKLSKYLATLAASGMIVSFIAVTGMSPSMSRAGLVTGLSLLAWYYGRKIHPLVLLPFAAAVTLLINPSYGWGDLGWQLSFAAFAGVMIVAPLAQAYFFGREKPRLLRQIIGETVSAQLCTLPIIVGAFGVFSNVALVANVLVLPLVPLAMLLTFIAGMGVLIAPGISGIVGLPAEWLLTYMTFVAEQLASLSWAQTELEVNQLGVALGYSAIVLMSVYMWRKTRLNLRDHNIVE